MNDEKIFQRCCRAYHRECERAGAIYQQPSSGSTWSGGKYRSGQPNSFVLENARGILARYAVNGDTVSGYKIKRIG
jgi:hypothetical protein